MDRRLSPIPFRLLLVAGRGVPFVFVTGYSADGIDARFRQVPVLQKPIDRAQLQKIFAPRGNGQLHVAGVPSLWPELARAIEPRGAGRSSVAELP